MGNNYAALEEKLARNYDLVIDPTVLSETRNFFHSHPDPTQATLSILLIKRLTKMTQHVIDDDSRKINYTLNTILIARRYCTEGINKILAGDIDGMDAESSFVRNMHGHLHSHASSISFEIERRVPSQQEKARALLSAFKHAHRAILLATENNEGDTFTGYMLIKRADAASRLANLAEAGKALKWREIAAEDYKEGAQKIEATSPFTAVSSYSLAVQQEYKIADMYQDKGDMKNSQRRTQNALNIGDHLSHADVLIQSQPISERKKFEEKIQYLRFDLAKHNRRMYRLTDRENYRSKAIKMLRSFISYQSNNHAVSAKSTDYARQLLQPLINNFVGENKGFKKGKLAFKRIKQEIHESEFG